jgi:hypothetical protein
MEDWKTKHSELKGGKCSPDLEHILIHREYNFNLLLLVLDVHTLSDSRSIYYICEVRCSYGSKDVNPKRLYLTTSSHGVTTQIGINDLPHAVSLCYAFVLRFCNETSTRACSVCVYFLTNFLTFV